MEGIGFHNHISPRSVHRRRVAVSLVDNQAVPVEPGSGGHTTIVRIRRQAPQNGALPLPHLSNGLRLPTHSALIISEARLPQVEVQLLKRGHRGNGHEEISATKPHRCLHTTLLPPSSGLAEMALEQVVGAKGDELPMFSTDFPFGHEAHGCREVVVTNAPGHAPKVLEGANMPVEKALLLLTGKRHDKASPTVR